MNTVFLLIVGIVLFITYVLVSGFCILKVFKSIFNNKSEIRFVSRSRQFKRGGEGTGKEPGSVYVKNLGVNRGTQQDELKGSNTRYVAPKQKKQDVVSLQGSVRQQDVMQEQDKLNKQQDAKKDRELLRKANAARQAAVALNKQMRRDKFSKGKW
ncbi:hypothetical protein [Borrelia sp. P9F1]|uniref:hypothetical protein n=1 Tax=Borrelia sp. P9F1 TaxID=3058374 RepID=UPI0026487341|nr:hypothetical protein [Borrelia sp. P9F1]WKC58502.1 hypothetical protein QYZ68_04805 [Borrelia sp. P9F1]